MRLAMFLVKFFFLGAFFIISNQNLALNEKGNFNIFLSSYSGWMEDLFYSGKAITGYVIKVDWMPKLENTPEKDIFSQQQKP